MTEYFTPHLDQAEALSAMASQAFVESFGHLYNERDLATFLAAAYGAEGIVKDLADAAYSFRAASEDGRIVGYAKVGPLGVPAPRPLPGAIELKQIYVLAPWHGAGIARELMDWAIATARDRGAPELYLSVFDHNHRAKRFYARYGFEDVGGCIFRVGEQLDEDRMWRRAL
jgi:GNAT superfamily N-acetyltransferase